MIELLEISKKLTKAANRWPLSEDRRLDVLRLAKRIRMDALTDTNIELLLIAAAAEGCRSVDSYADETGLSRKEAGEILHRLWMQGTLERAEERIHERGRPGVIFVLAGEFPSKENNSFPDDLDLLP